MATQAAPIFQGAVDGFADVGRIMSYFQLIGLSIISAIMMIIGIGLTTKNSKSGMIFFGVGIVILLISFLWFYMVRKNRYVAAVAGISDLSRMI
jgi:hypothetical protein